MGALHVAWYPLAFPGSRDNPQPVGELVSEDTDCKTPLRAS